MRPYFRPAALVALGSMLHLPLSAQQSGIGLKAGLTLSDLHSGAYTSRSIPNASAGMYVALRAGARLEIQPELLVSSLGAGYLLEDGGRATVRALYAQLPLSAKIYIGNAFNVNAGLQLGRLLYAEQHSDQGAVDLTGQFNRWDQGVIIGTGVDLVSGTDIGLRLYNGLSPVWIDDQVHFPRHRSVTLSIGHRLARISAPRFKRKRH